MTDNQTLLAEYARTGSDAAFRELVTCYVDLVHSTALRLVEGDTHRAEDVTQTVFVDLARSAQTLAGDVKLGGWLHRHTCFVTSTVLRGERRRQSRERQATEMNALQNHSEADYSLVAPLLDEAINELGEADRTAILLRFFEKQDFRAVGQALGSNEDAARMRVTRALEKLEEFLKRRGITTTAASLGVVLTANAVQAAPAGLVVTISTAAALAGTTLTATATTTAIKTIAMTTFQKTVITATLAIVAGAGIYEARQASRLRDQVQMLQEQQAPMAEQLQQLHRGYDEATNRLAALRDDNERLNRNTAELLKLRGEVGTLKRKFAEATKIQAQPTVLTDQPNQPNDVFEQQKLMAGSKAGDAHIYLTAFLDYSDTHNGQFPTNWDQIRDKYNSAPGLSGTNQFEIIPHPKLNVEKLDVNLGTVALIREFLAWRTVDSKWGKIYGFADGHADTVILSDGNFTAWEKQHTYQPSDEAK